MIQQDKLKLMTQLAMYEKKKGKEDFSIYSYQRDDYVRFQGIKTLVAATAAFLILIGFVLIWNIDTVIGHFDTYDYKKVGFLLLAAYLVFLIFYLNISRNRSRERYQAARPRVRRYHRNIRKREELYENEDKVREEFEKGEWRDGK